jgi:hypothetical protein
VPLGGDSRARPLQARGQHNPRDFDTHIFALPFPAYDGTDQMHQDLGSLAARAEEVAAGIDLDPSWQFQKARRVMREALAEEGVGSDIDPAVEELLADAPTEADAAVLQS